MMTIWKSNMVRFHNNNNHKYLTLGHRLLMGVAGWYSLTLVEDILHNRTANVRGGKGRILALDLVNEHYNAQTKANMKHSNSNYTTKTVKRSSQMVGAVAQKLGHFYGVNVARVNLSDQFRKKYDYTDDIAKFVEEFNAEGFF